MIKKLVFIILLHTTLGQSQSLEDAIYDQLDEFVEHPSSKQLNQLSLKAVEFSSQTKTSQEHLALVVLYSNMGYYYREFGQLQKARSSYEKAWTVYRNKKLEGYDIIEYCLKPLGNLYTKLGDFSNAETIIKLYLTLAEQQKNSEQKIAGLLNLSVVYHNTSKHHTAIELLQEGLGIPGLEAEQKSALENNLATNLLALKKFKQVQSLIDQTPTRDVLTLKNMAQLAAQQGDVEKALSILNEVKSKFKQKPPPARELARFYVEKASLYEQSKRIQKAKQTYQKALQTLIPRNTLNSLPAVDMLYAENTFISIFDGLAALQTDPQKALEYYDLSFFVSSLLYEEYTNQEVKINHQYKWKQRTERCLEILFEQYATTQDQHYMYRAFSYVEASKARVLREQTSQKSLLKSHPEDSLLQKSAQLQALQEQHTNTYVRAQLSDANPKTLQHINDSLNLINLELKAIQNQISLKYPNADSQVVSLQELQKSISRDKAFLVLYFLGKNNLYRFEISHTTVNFYKKTLNEGLHQQISGFIDYFNDSSVINNDILGFQDNAFSLFTSMLPQSLPKDTNLIIIPDSLLHFVPFEALLVKHSQSLSYANMPFLIKHNTVSYHTSASLYHKAKTPDTKTSVLGVFPVFENSSKSLTYSIDEAKEIRHWLDSKHLLHEEASKQNFIDLAQNHSILHLSTHANSGTFTIPATLEFYDDVMLLQELYSLDLNPKLVVLSACETGVGKIQSGEGPMSLARGFQYAGAQNLLFSLWEVNDLSTSQLMASFYKHYSETYSAFKANQNSKLYFLENQTIPNAKKSPYYWSGFVYYGALDKEQNEYSLLFWVMGIIGVGLLVLVIMKSTVYKNRNTV